jgi:hypothetical protein
MVHQERLEIGEKCFVSSIMMVLAAEAGWTIVTNGMHLSWLGLLLGVAGFCLVLFLANGLYAGNRQAHKIALAWIGFQVLYAALALYLLSPLARETEAARQIGAPAAWPVVVKVLVYVYLGWVLMRMPTVRDFFAEKRGDVRAPDLLAQKAAVALEPSTPLEISADQAEGLRGLAQYLRLSVGALITLGALQILLGLKYVSAQGGVGLLILGTGVLTAILGMALGAPSNELRPLATGEEQTKGQLVSAFAALAKFYKVQIIFGVLIAAATAARFFITLR